MRPRIDRGCRDIDYRYEQQSPHGEAAVSEGEPQLRATPLLASLLFPGFLSLARLLSKLCPPRLASSHPNNIKACCPKRLPAKSACLEGPILAAHIGTLHSPAVSHLLSDTAFPQLGILLFVPMLAGFLLRTTQVRSAPVSNWQPLSHRRYHVRRRNTEELYRSLETHTIATSPQPPSRIQVDDNVRGRRNPTA